MYAGPTPVACGVREYLTAGGMLPRHIRQRGRASPWQRFKRWLAAAPVHPPAGDAMINYHALLAEWRAAR
jgi:hypothetical protein